MRRANKYPDYPIETRKDHKVHCIRLEADGPIVCFNCPHDDCRHTARSTKEENEYNSVMFMSLNDTYNRR